MVEHLTPDPEIKSLNPDAFQHHEATAKQNYLSLISGGSKVVEQLTPDPEIKGLNPAATLHQE